LHRLGFQTLKPDLSSLNQIYSAWCQRVPFDNLIKRQYLNDIKLKGQPLPTEDFFESYLTHGTGGTCWNTSLALYSLLKELNFPVRIAAGDMLVPFDLFHPNHGSIIATFGKDQYLVDTSMRSKFVLQLHPSQSTSSNSGVYSIHGKPQKDGWLVTWKPAHGRSDLDCSINMLQVTPELVIKQYQKTVSASPFNSSLYASIHHNDGLVTCLDKKVILIDPQGNIAEKNFKDKNERNDYLKSTFQYSEAAIDKIADETGNLTNF